MPSAPSAGRSSKAGTSSATEPVLRGLFDHAGMFPPAAKPLSAALQDAASFPRTLARPGLVGADLVVAWKDWVQLDEAALRTAGFAADRPCRIALVGVPLEQAADAARMVGGAGAQHLRMPVVSLEVHAEADVDAEALRKTVAAANTPVFLEPRWPPTRVRDHVGHVALVCKVAGAGLKVRCAGATALDRPALAAAVVAAADAHIPFKATQGLHHPVPRPGFPHGFLGLVAAVRIKQADPSFNDVAACLAETDVTAFRLDDGIAWRGHHVPASTIAALPPFAIGSCSLVEPDEDLMAAFGPAPAQ